MFSEVDSMFTGFLSNGESMAVANRIKQIASKG